MKDDNKTTKKQLLYELTELHSQNAALKESITASISAEFVAAESSRYAESIVETVREPLLVLDADLKIISANRHFYRTFKVTPGETIGSFICDLGNKQWDIPKLRELLETILPQKATFDNYEVEHDFATIGRRTMLLNARQIERVLGKEKIILLAIEDITERKRMEEDLQKSEVRLRAVLDLTPFPIALVDVEDNHIDFWSNSALTLFGHTAPTASEWFQIAYPDPDYQLEVIDRWKASLEKARLSAQAVNVGAYRVTCRDGSVRICDIFVAFLEGSLIVTFNDITERNNLELDNSRFAAIVESADDAIIGKDLDGNIESWNSGAEVVYGYKAKEIIGKSISLIMPPGHPDEYKELLTKRSSGDLIKNYETQRMRKDGKIIDVSLTISPIKNISGEITGASIIARDITEKKKQEKRMEQAIAATEASNKELAAFSYSVSHDLRAPLRSIDGFSLALLEEYQEKLDETGKTYLERVRAATQKMGLLIDDMLKLSRITQSELKREAVDLSKMVLAIAEGHQKINPDRSFDVTVQEGIMVQGDPYLMKIAMENLIGNAWKFTGKEAHPRIEFGTTVRDGEAACFIRDNGVGFDMAYVSKLFGAFQRLHTTDEFPGTGIGLATVQRIIHRYGGRVWAEGEIGKGATFYFTLPPDRERKDVTMQPIMMGRRKTDGRQNHPAGGGQSR
jgi:PAS domain S-box-containing protein